VRTAAVGPLDPVRPVDTLAAIGAIHSFRALAAARPAVVVPVEPLAAIRSAVVVAIAGLAAVVGAVATFASLRPAGLRALGLHPIEPAYAVALHVTGSAHVPVALEPLCRPAVDPEA
jgi:hypothetical protein